MTESFRGVSVLGVVLCSLAAAAMGGCASTDSSERAGGAAKPAAEVAAGPRMIEVTIANPSDASKAESLAAAAAAVRSLRARQKGFVSSLAGRTEQGGMLEATTWASLSQVEAGSLALAGSKENGELKAAAGTGTQSLFFRELRSYRYPGATAGHLEVVVFRTKAGVSVDEHLAAFDAAEADFASSGGLAGHDLGISPDGRWVHVVHWKSAAVFDTVGKGLMKQPGIAGWFKTLDYRQFTMQRGDVVGVGSAAAEKPASGK